MRTVVKHAHAQPVRFHLVHLYFYLSAIRSVLEGIGKQIAHNLLKLVAVHPYIQVLFVTPDSYLNMPKASRIGKNLCESIQLSHCIIFRNAKTQGVYFQLVEVEHLVYEYQHAVHADAHRVECFPHRARQRIIAFKHDQRTCNKGERITELVRDVGKEIHVHLVGAFVAPTLVYQLLYAQPVALCIQICNLETIDDERDARNVEIECCPREPERRLNDYLRTAFLSIATMQGVFHTHSECICSWREMCIVCRRVC